MHRTFKSTGTSRTLQAAPCMLFLTVGMLLTACGGGGSAGVITGDQTATVTGTDNNPSATSSIGTTPVPVPDAVAKLSIATYGVKSFGFTWDASSRASYYQLAQDPDGTGTSESIVAGNITSNGTTYHLDSQLLHQRIGAKYRVRACNASGCSAYSEAVTTARTDANQAIGYFKASDAYGDDRFGGTVALSADGSTLAVGADSRSNETGAVYVYARTGGVWSEQKVLTGEKPGVRFGTALALSDDGNILAVGNQTDEAFVYTRSGTAWDSGVRLTPDVQVSGSSFGASVAVSGDGSTLGIGASAYDCEGATDCGAVFIFIRTGQNWGMQKSIRLDSPLGNDYWGSSVALSFTGDTLAAGTANVFARKTGLACLATRSGASWSSPNCLTPSDATEYLVDLNFGGALALSADGLTLAVGSYPSSSKAFSGSAVYTFNYYPSDGEFAGYWYQNSKIASKEVCFGCSVSLSADGKILAVGNLTESNNAKGINGSSNSSTNYSGAAYIYENTAQDGDGSWAWTKRATLKAPNSAANIEFGNSLALSDDGTTLAVGAFKERNSVKGISNGDKGSDGKAFWSGAVYLY